MDEQQIYRDPARPLEERVSDLLQRMTLEEKAAQTSAPFAAMNEVHSPPPLGWGCAAAALSILGLPPREAALAANELQRKHVEETRLGIPVLLAEECLIGFKVRDATVYPDAIAQAATWDPELIHEMASSIGRQMALLGVRQALSPLADVGRDPRWGRVEETYGEDPYLVGSMATAFVRGLQSADPDVPVMATLKHFIGYSASEGGRNTEPAHVGERALRETYGVPFEMAIRDGGARGVMCAYNAIDGVPVQGSAALLTDLLRGEYGFSGVLIADLASVSQLHTKHRTAVDRQDAVRQAIEAGLDLELYDEGSTDLLVDAVRSGRLPEAALDRSIRNVLRMKFSLGLFERPYVDADVVPATLDGPAERVLARKVAEKSIILLQNRPVDGRPVLPLGDDVRTIAVIGPNADRPMGYLGNYSYHVLDSITALFTQAANPEKQADEVGGLSGFSGPWTADGATLRVESVPIVTALEGIRQRAGADRVVLYEPGCAVVDDDRSGFKAATRVAAAADVAVVVVGDQAAINILGTVGEGVDSATCALPGVQRELLEAVVATGTPTVVVLSHGRAYVLGWMANSVPAIVSSFFGGEEAGNAIAAVLFGDVNPAGRTPISFPRSVGALPVPYAQAATGGDSYTQGSTAAVFPFGHGESYTTFEYRLLEIRSPTAPTSGEMEVSITVANVGTRSGEEVVQLYAKDVYASTLRPALQLVGFRRIHLEPSQVAKVSFSVPATQLSLWEPTRGWIVEPGEIEFHAGGSSRDLPLSGCIELTGQVHRAGPSRRLSGDSTVAFV